MSVKPSESILFVCTGNVCRSPMAEVLLRARLGPGTDITVGSAGVAAASTGYGACPVACRDGPHNTIASVRARNTKLASVR